MPATQILFRLYLLHTWLQKTSKRNTWLASCHAAYVSHFLLKKGNKQKKKLVKERTHSRKSDRVFMDLPLQAKHDATVITWRHTLYALIHAADVNKF